jgi:NAD(P)H dehydrogenase (quinone)
MSLMSILINYGFLVFGLTDYSGIKFSAHYGAISAGAPEEERVQEACRRLGLRLSEWTARMIYGREEAHPLNQTYDRFKDLGK